MSYQVLARKWRPKNFDELQGQEHVSRALINAIESDRLHHAYLFTGTRGVGKTTIARILSKCLNCETNGLTAKPCGECASCVEIDQGRFVDLIEVDAASRTKVDDTRELLDNVQYRPTRGHYKVYLIDEVHMLSNSSFNALLKTLEEPPEHVIFLLATTDPQKLPVTVLSRCLQFHLKHMDEAIISKHLAYILGQESIEFEPAALNLIAQSAEGSMRDGLSLLDQAIAFGQGKVSESDIRTMLGTIDHQFMEALLQALTEKDSHKAIKAIDEMSNFPVDFADALKELLSRLHQIAIFQVTGVLLDNSAAYIEKFAEVISSDDIQLYYQLGLHARRDLAWAATPKQGLEMALLRMLAFKIAPAGKESSTSAATEAVKKKASQLVAEPDQTAEPEQTAEQKSLADDASVKSSSVAKKSAVSSDNSTNQEVFVESQSHEPPFDPNDYAAALNAVEADEEASSMLDRSVAAAATPVKVSKTKGTVKPEGSKPDPLASLHAALGIATDSSGDDKAGVAEKTPSRVSQKNTDFTQKALEDELEETTKTPKQLDQQAIDPNLANETSEAQELAITEKAFSEAFAESDTVVTDPDIEAAIESAIKVNRDAQLIGTIEEKVTQKQPQVESEEASQQQPKLPQSSESHAWAELLLALDMPGTYHQIAQSSNIEWLSDDKIVIKVAPSQEVICTDSAKAGVEQALIEYFNKTIKVDWAFAEPKDETPAMIWQRQADEKKQKACDELNKHPFAVQLQELYGAQLDTASIEYLN